MRRLVAFVVLAYALSWAWWVPMALTGTVVEPGQGWPTHLPGLLGPAIAAVIVTAVTDRGPGLRDLWSRVSRWRVPIRWYILVIATMALAAIPFVLGTDLGMGDALAYSGAPSVGVSVVVYVVLVNGFGEEIGWRGYLADGLMHRHSEIATALIVWLVWAGWHLPLFWIVDSFRGFGIAGSIGWFVGLGFGSVGDVRQGKVIDLDINETDAAKARCEDLAARITTCQQQATALDGQRQSDVAVCSASGQSRPVIGVVPAGDQQQGRYGADCKPLGAKRPARQIRQHERRKHGTGQDGQT